MADPFKPTRTEVLAMVATGIALLGAFLFARANGMFRDVSTLPPATAAPAAPIVLPAALQPQPGDTPALRVLRTLVRPSLPEHRIAWGLASSESIEARYEPDSGPLVMVLVIRRPAARDHDPEGSRRIEVHDHPAVRVDWPNGSAQVEWNSGAWRFVLTAMAHATRPSFREIETAAGLLAEHADAQPAIRGVQ